MLPRSESVQCIVGYLQIAIEVGQNCAVSFPRVYQYVAGALAIVNLDIVPWIRLPCWLPDFDHSEKLVLVTAAPIAAAACLGFWWGCEKSRRSHDRANRIAYFFFILSFLVYVNTSSTILQFFHCHDFP
jgi:hypothetical protein